jgi:hypothetical protein
VPPCGDGKQVPVIVYSRDFSDREDVLRVGALSQPGAFSVWPS